MIGVVHVGTHLPALFPTSPDEDADDLLQRPGPTAPRSVNARLYEGVSGDSPGRSAEPRAGPAAGLPRHVAHRPLPAGGGRRGRR